MGNSQFRSAIMLCGKIRYLGTYTTAEEAARVYDNAVFYLRRWFNRGLRRINFRDEWEHDSVPSIHPVVMELSERMKDEYGFRESKEDVLAKLLETVRKVEVAQFEDRIDREKLQVEVAALRADVENLSKNFCKTT